MNLSEMQERVGRWVVSTFGEAIASNGKERALRVAEEALELAQALGVTRVQLHRLVDYVFGRPVGLPSQEIAGCMVTLAAVAGAVGADLERVVWHEMVRIETPEVVARCRARQDEKRAELLTGDGA